MCTHAPLVLIIDPGINNVQNYEPYSYGLSHDVFVKVRVSCYCV